MINKLINENEIKKGRISWMLLVTPLTKINVSFGVPILNGQHSSSDLTHPRGDKVPTRSARKNPHRESVERNERKNENMGTIHALLCGERPPFGMNST